MAVFYYRGKNLAGEIMYGFHETQNVEDVIQLLKKKGFFPITIRKAPFYSMFYFIRDITLKKRYKELAFFCRQMSSMLEAGMPVMECLSVLCQQSLHPGLARALRRLINDLNKGFTLSEAFKNQPGIFPEILIYAIETGEVAGKLEDILKKLATHFETMAKYRERLKTSMTYPIILSLISIIVYYFIANTLLPLYSNMFNQAGLSLPLLTRIFIAITINSKRFAIFLLFVFVLFLLLYYKLKQDPEKVFLIDKFLLSFPVLGLLQKNSIAAHFCRIAGILVSSGISVVKTIEVIENTMNNQVFKKDLQKALENLKMGKTLADSLETSNFPIFMLRMMQMGVESGKLEEILFKIADFYDSETEVLQIRLLSLIEPIAILLLSLIIGFAVVATILPMFKMYSVF